MYFITRARALIFLHLFARSFNVRIKLLIITNMNTKKFLDLCTVDNLPVKFFSSLKLRIRGDNCQNSFSYNYLKTIQVVSVHKSEAYWEVLQGFYHKTMVYYHLHMQQNWHPCYKNMSNIFILKRKVNTPTWIPGVHQILFLTILSKMSLFLLFVHGLTNN